MLGGGLNIGDLLLTLLADGSLLRLSIEKQGLAAANAAGPAIGASLGASIATGLTRSGKAMSTLGKSMTKNLTLPIVAAGTAITAVGLQFDTKLRQIVALTDVTAAEIGGVRDAILELAPAIGKSPQELADAFYFLASGGFNAQESLDILTVSAKAAASGLGETQDVTKVIGAAINAFGKDNLKAVDAVDELVRAIKDGTAEAPDFAGALGDVVGSAGLLGANFSDTAGAIAAMTKIGINADEAATSLNQVFRALIKTTPQAAKGFATVGLTVEGLKQQLKEKGLLSVLQTLDQAFKDNDVAAGQAFGNVRALRGVLALLGDHLPSTVDILKDVANGTTDLGSAFADTEGPGREIDKAMAQIQVTLINLSQDTLPLVVELVQDVADVLKAGTAAFKQLPDPVRSFAVRALALTAALGPLVFIMGKVVSGLGGIFHAVDVLSKTRVVNAVTGPIASALTAAKNSRAVAAASTGVGKFIGSTIGKGILLGFAAVGIVEGIQEILRIDAENQAQHDVIASGVKDVVAKQNKADLMAAKAGLEQGIKDIQNNTLAQILDFPTHILPGFGGKSEIDRQVRELQTQLDAVNAALVGDHRDELIHDSTSGGYSVGGAFVDGVRTGIEKKAPELSAAAKAAGKAIPQSIAKGIIEQQMAPSEAFESLKKLMKQAMYPMQRIARDIGILTSKALAKALRDKRPVVSDEAKRVRDVAEKDLAQLILDGGKVGKAAGQRLRDALHSKNPVIRKAAQRVRAIIKSELDKTPAAAAKAGTNTGNAFATHMVAAVRNVANEVYAIINSLFGGIPNVPAPKPKKKPGDPGNAVGGPVVAGVPTWVNENTPRSEMFVPSVSGHILTHSQAVAAVKASAGQAGGGDLTINVPVNGALPVRTSRDIVTELRRIGDLGILPPPTLPPQYPRRLVDYR